MSIRSRAPSRWFVTLVAAVVVASIGGYVLGSTVRSPEDILARAKPPTESTLTVGVREGSLKSSESVEGKAEWRSTFDVAVAPSDSGLRAVVTATPLGTGGGVYPGRVLVEVSDRPVIALGGAVPMLRDLHPGDTGADVTRLQDGLRSAGYYSSASDGVFGTGTLAALEDLYEAAGYPVPTQAMSRRGDRSVGEDARGEYAAASELAFVPVLPATLLDYPAGVGDDVQRSVAKVAVGGVTIRVDLPSTWRTQLRPGTSPRAAIRVRAARGKVYDGVVEQVGPPRVVEGRGEVVSVTIGPHSGQQTEIVSGERVEVTVTDRAAPTGLLVPLAALYTSAEDGDFVRVVRDDVRTRVPVRIKATGGGTAVVVPQAPPPADAGRRGGCGR